MITIASHLCSAASLWKPRSKVIPLVSVRAAVEVTSVPKPQHTVRKRQSNYFQTLRGSRRMEAPSGKPKGFPKLNQQVQQQDPGSHVPWQGAPRDGSEGYRVGTERPGAVSTRKGQCGCLASPPTPHKVTQSMQDGGWLEMSGWVEFPQLFSGKRIQKGKMLWLKWMP